LVLAARAYVGLRLLVNATAIISLLLLAALLPVAAAAHAAQVRLMVFGDSLTAGYGLEPSDAFPAKLGAALRAKGYDVKIINAGVSGDTSAGGKARLAWALADKPDAVIVELGANDGLRGIEPQVMAANLDAILKGLQKAGVRVLLTGMRAPPNLGPEYVREFDAVFPALAKRYGVPLYPFFLAGVAADPRLNQDDGIHPNPAGVDVIVGRILPYVERLIVASE
jgi:acyl-CoA thioesterase-1